jgi:hypothetical protein
MVNGPKKKDPLSEARLLLAGIEADLRVNSDKLRQLRAGGADHFRERLAWAQHRGLNEGNVDAWCREAAGIASATKK